MTPTTYFNAVVLESLRLRVSEKRINIGKYPNGWSKSKIDPMTVLEVFSSLHIKKGFVLRAYQFVSDNDGNGIVWAMPKDSIFPKPNGCSKMEDSFLECPRPDEALEDIMEVIEGDGSAFSYISASIFAREISEFGAYWHGCEWGTHRIIDEQYSSDEFSFKDIGSFSFEDIENWDWIEKMPKKWQPSVKMTHDKVIVNFYTYSGLAVDRVERNTDTFAIGSYHFVSDSKMIAKGEGGYIF